VERSETWGKASPRNQSLEKATHEPAPTLRIKRKSKALAQVSSFAAAHIDGMTVSPPQTDAFQFTNMVK
jgi:hypothetical protein